VDSLDFPEIKEMETNFLYMEIKKEKTLACETLFYLILETDRRFQKADLSKGKERDSFTIFVNLCT